LFHSLGALEKLFNATLYGFKVAWAKRADAFQTFSFRPFVPSIDKEKQMPRQVIPPITPSALLKFFLAWCRSGWTSVRTAGKTEIGVHGTSTLATTYVGVTTVDLNRRLSFRKCFSYAL
jgi:hypothetical protein